MSEKDTHATGDTSPHSHGPETPKDNRPLTQAERVIARFGGVPQLLRALRQAGFDKQRAAIYKWTYPIEKGGRGGLIPTQAWPEIMAAARLEGIAFTAEDLDPRGEVVKRTWKPGPKAGWKKAKEETLKKLREELAAVEAELAAKEARAKDDGVNYE